MRKRIARLLAYFGFTTKGSDVPPNDADIRKRMATLRREQEDARRDRIRQRLSGKQPSEINAMLARGDTL